MEIHVVQVPHLTLQMTNAEARAFLVDPEPLQATVRAALADHIAATQVRKNGITINPSLNGKRAYKVKPGKTPKEKKGKAKRSGKDTPYKPTLPCTMTGCDRKFETKQGLAVHLSKSHRGTLTPTSGAGYDPDEEMNAGDDNDE